MRLIADMIAYTVEQVPKWNPINICSYHLQEAGATPVQEIAYAMSNAIAVLDAARERVPEDRMGAVFGRISFFVNAGVRFVEEHAKLRAMGILWEELGRERYGVTDAKQLRLRYGVQVNSLGPDGVPAGEQRPADRARGARRDARAATRAPARSSCRPGTRRSACRARGTSSGRCASSRCSPRRPTCSSTRTSSRARRSWTGSSPSCSRARAPRWPSSPSTAARCAAVDYMKAALVDSHRERLRRIESGEQIVVGLNSYTESEASPLLQGADGGILTVDPTVESAAARGASSAGARTATRPPSTPRWPSSRASPQGDENIMPATIAAARAGVTTGEWARDAARRSFGEYRAPTGVGEAAAHRRLGGRPPSCATRSTASARRSGAGSRSSSASPASTATPTAPSRSPCAHATRAWTSSTRASA